MTEQELSSIEGKKTPDSLLSTTVVEDESKHPQFNPNQGSVVTVTVFNTISCTSHVCACTTHKCVCVCVSVCVCMRAYMHAYACVCACVGAYGQHIIQ